MIRAALNAVHDLIAPPYDFVVHNPKVAFTIAGVNLVVIGALWLAGRLGEGSRKR